jgi:hypothetical protein
MVNSYGIVLIALGVFLAGSRSAGLRRNRLVLTVGMIVIILWIAASDIAAEETHLVGTRDDN